GGATPRPAAASCRPGAPRSSIGRAARTLRCPSAIAVVESHTALQFLESSLTHFASYVDNRTSTPYRPRDTVASEEGERYATSTGFPIAAAKFCTVECLSAHVESKTLMYLGL